VAAELTNGVRLSLLRRIAYFAISAIVASVLTYAIPSFAYAILNQQTPTWIIVTFPLFFGVFGGLDVWVALGLAWFALRSARLDWNRSVLGLAAGALAGSVYVCVAFLMAQTLPDPHQPVTASVMRHGLALLFTPYTQAKMVSIHSLVGWARIPWIFILAPIPACIVGGTIYGGLTPRRHALDLALPGERRG
jgi:hypothetical protein